MAALALRDLAEHAFFEAANLDGLTAAFLAAVWAAESGFPGQAVTPLLHASKQHWHPSEGFPALCPQ